MGRLCRMRIAALGDVMLDVIVRLAEPLTPGGDVRAETRTTTGGQAANVAAWAAQLGADARCIAKRGDDPTGEPLARQRGARGVTVVTEDARLDLSPVPADVVDTTGAGDALAAGFLLGGSLEQATRRGLEAAARCVSNVGAMP